MTRLVSSSPHRARRFLSSVLVGLVLLLVLSVLALGVGAADVSTSDVLGVLESQLFGVDNPAGDDPVLVAIVWSLRTPRMLVAALVGAALALAGAQLQGLFRNPLASPDIIGTSAGGSLGAVLALSFHLADRSLLYVPLLAIAGAFGSLLLVTRIATRQGTTPVATLLLTGIAVTALLGAVNSWLIARSWEEFEVARRITFWLMGGVADRGWVHVAILLPGVVLGSVVSFAYARDLDLLLEGEETAAALGVEVEQAKRIILGNAALLTGSAVAVSGVVGFIGLVVPHLVRLWIGPGHRLLIPACLLTGAWLLLGADLLARTLAAPVELHLGVVTSFLGAPFFLFLLSRHRRDTSLF